MQTPIRCQTHGGSIKVPCTDICPQAHTQCWHPTSGLILQTVSPLAPWVLITAITHLSRSVLQTMSCPLQGIGDDRSINWSVIKPGQSYTASQMPPASWANYEFMKDSAGLLSSLMVVTRISDGASTAGMLMTSCYLLNHHSFQGSGCSGHQSYELMHTLRAKYSTVTSYPKNGSNVISMYTWF